MQASIFSGREARGSLIVLLIALSLLSRLQASQILPSVAGDPTSELSVNVEGNVLTASRNNTVSIEIVNIGKYLSNLDVTLNVPSPLILFGDNHWIRSTFKGGDSIRVTVTIFAPSQAAGNTLQGSIVAVYKEAGETKFDSETHLVGFLVRGWIDMTLYDTAVDPDPTGPGSTITVSGNLLNRGIIAAMYTNVSLLAQAPLLAGSIKASYVGQVDPNAPAPFSISAVVDPATPEGLYSLRIQVSYRDDLHADKDLIVSIALNVAKPPAKTEQRPSAIPFVGFFGENALYALVGIVIALVAIGFFIRRRRRAR